MIFKRNGKRFEIIDIVNGGASNEYSGELIFYKVDGKLKVKLIATFIEKFKEYL